MKKILKVEKTFLDFEANLQSSTDHLELRLKPMIDIEPSSKKGVLSGFRCEVDNVKVVSAGCIL